MEAIKLREKLINEINSADDALLKVVEDAIESYHNVAVPIVSEPLTISEYNKEIALAEEDIAKGDVFTQDEVSEIINRWKRR